MKLMGRWANWITCGIMDVMHVQARLIRAQNVEIEALKRVIDCYEKENKTMQSIIDLQHSMLKLDRAV